MNLVGEQDDAVRTAERTDLREFFLRPDPAHWIVRIAEDHHGSEGCGELFFKVGKVDPIRSSPVPHEAALEDGSPRIFHRVKENIIHRRQKDDAVADVRYPLDD